MPALGARLLLQRAYGHIICSDKDTVFAWRESVRGFTSLTLCADKR
jgi:hypothetical protein